MTARSRDAALRAAVLVGASALAAACSPHRTAAREPALEAKWNADALIPEFVQERPASPADFERILRAPWVEGPKVQVGDGDRREDRAIGSCKELLDLDGRIRRVYSPARDNEVMMWKVMCEGVQRMPRIRPARIDHLPRDVQSLVPALASVTVPSPDPDRRSFFRGLGEVRSLKCPDAIGCSGETPSRSFTVSLMAAGDLDGDGVGDVMLQANSSDVGSRVTTTIGIVVTRAAPGGALKVIESW